MSIFGRHEHLRRSCLGIVATSEASKPIRFTDEEHLRTLLFWEDPDGSVPPTQAARGEETTL